MRKTLFLVLLTTLVTACQPTKTENAPIENAPLKIKAVVVTMFEIGEDEGDKPGEFQIWKERQQLNTRYAFPQSHHDIYVNEQTGVMAIVTGMGIARATSAVMALGLDERFDLSKAYWLVAGIAGIDPEDASIGSAAWAEYLVDGDLAHEIDAREIPDDWATGYFPLFANAPYPETKQTDTHHAPNGEVYQLNTGLVNWAYEFTKDIELMDTPAMQALRAHYTEHPNAMAPPIVLKGDQLAASTFWHGELLNQWANEWTEFWTNGEGNFVTSAMEDTGSYQAMIYLDRIGKADKDRFLVLRTASNFSMQPPGLTAAENLAAESTGAGYAGMVPALEAAYRVGSKVVNEIVSHWDQYEHNIPQASNE